MKRVSKLLTALVLGTVLAGLAAGCGGGEKKADTIKVGANLEMTGAARLTVYLLKMPLSLPLKRLMKKAALTANS